MKVVVLGGGESGCGAAYLAKKQGMEVFLSDKGAIKDHYKQFLTDNDIEFEEENHDEERILSADWIVKSPGIPKKADIIQKIQEKGIRLSSEIEFASEFTNAKIIAITGSNGKTTTTSLIYYILKNDGLNVGLGGNIGQSFARQVADENHEYYVLEVSSFQLDDIQNFRPYISLLLNLSKDHLDQYNYNYEEYALAKFRITENQENDNFFIYNKDDEMSKSLLEKLEIKARMIPFSTKEPLPEGGFVKGEDTIVVKLKDEFSMKIDELSLMGNHNVANSLAASIAGKILEINNESIRNSLMTFQAVEHRLELVSEQDGIKYINDSKATNVNATYYALESMKTPTVWIVGGVDKGNDYSEIEDLVKRKVKAIVCLGIDNQKIISYFKDKKEMIYDTSSMEEAVKTAKALAKKGDTVLLSPCCASFDLFKSYEDRGRQFKEQVLK
ncbi:MULTISPECIES: UDP-N-acetylmuramoyl-L-alanine--D-glutamate ligase [Chryseobacterium]|uniref:UDP-N-acetylmuramoylalanine--D-glutamate ligase n=1 Tax=Chryseobacterium camelliae TaxID=1265445 RepID=A0ABU0TMM1_9FLAO|nr:MULTISPECIES: UDP-N-acetylmuramoyl-L-alanine--D-glutamate ligase [Chryseobacterium]MDT3407866.1 UDP-N-acetylmuramoylalanine--D-glutamate ligase [Pseudacidovorax intermedius]MDQ1098279.1 UDP-N-acetylmuramoylalanine--D-glutamate ligase [Chryseobacterium camelliae]MDQ1102204.1 UDP-N-acetylmuramoylalanine--D-glutamate ligase [Chryseobacterium sp. SORGH_AS_1048]MDR6085642.1 UDP-N-acetylmuramoylalanine--D-glutamate ligase [Chryseobacterium sp. SORGH_AS_0909]MDR6130008.1 UDP-N-acetylmuramoylalanin